MEEKIDRARSTEQAEEPVILKLPKALLYSPEVAAELRRGDDFHRAARKLSRCVGMAEVVAVVCDLMEEVRQETIDYARDQISEAMERL